MEPSPGQRKAVFALIVFVLAGLGSYLFLPGALGAGSGGSPTPVPAVHSPAPAASPPRAAVTPTPSAAPQRPDIYQWLPFTPSELASAAAAIIAFGRDYGTLSYTENAARYVGAMRSLITPRLAQVLAGGYSAPGVAGLRESLKQVSAGSASIDALRAFGPSSITFVVTLTQVITDVHGRSRIVAQYAITVAGAGAGWQVSDIEAASAGNP